MAERCSCVKVGKPSGLNPGSNYVSRPNTGCNSCRGTGWLKRCEVCSGCGMVPGSKVCVGCNGIGKMSAKGEHG